MAKTAYQGSSLAQMQEKCMKMHKIRKDGKMYSKALALFIAFTMAFGSLSVFAQAVRCRAQAVKIKASTILKKYPSSSVRLSCYPSNNEPAKNRRDVI